MQGFRYASPPACFLVHFQRTIGQIPYRSLCFVMPLSNEKMPIGIGQRAVCKERCQRHRTMVASHTAVPLGFSKWLGKRHHIPGTLPLGKGQELTLSPTVKAGLYFGGARHTSHLLSLASRTVTVGSKHPRAFLYGWLPLSNAYGISFQCNLT